jgi:hypothetical protein
MWTVGADAADAADADDAVAGVDDADADADAADAGPEAESVAEGAGGAGPSVAVVGPGAYPGAVILYARSPRPPPRPAAARTPTAIHPIRPRGGSTFAAPSSTLVVAVR